MPEAGPVYTIGYGSRSLDELVAALKQHEIACVLDVRTAPYSKFRPEFSKSALEVSLPPHGLRYVFIGDLLGGRPDSPDCYVDGKVDYDQVREKEFYRRGIERVCRAHEQGMHLALFCAEGRPDACHRSKLIGVTLAEMGIPLAHIDEAGELLTQDEVIGKATGYQPSLFGAPSLTSRKRYGGDP